jgi:hypothetical protein
VMFIDDESEMEKRLVVISVPVPAISESIIDIEDATREITCTFDVDDDDTKSMNLMSADGALMEIASKVTSPVVERVVNATLAKSN